MSWDGWVLSLKNDGLGSYQTVIQFNFYHSITKSNNSPKTSPIVLEKSP